MNRKALMILFTITALIMAGALAVMAQDDDDDPTPFGPGWMHDWDGANFGMGMMHGHGMMGGGFGPGMMGNTSEPMMLDVAEALGLELDAFYDALRDGQTLTEIAEAQDVELETVYAAMLTHAEEHLADMVEAGYLTQEQADEHLVWMRENIATMPMFSGGFGAGMDGHGGFGAGMGGHGGFGPGMMGHRQGR